MMKVHAVTMIKANLNVAKNFYLSQNILFKASTLNNNSNNNQQQQQQQQQQQRLTVVHEM